MSRNLINLLFRRAGAVAWFLSVMMAGSVHAQTDATPPPSTTPAPTVQSATQDTTQSGTVPGADITSSTYRLQPYDLIDVDVYSEPDLHKPARLGSDGTVLLPLIGSVKVGGLTVTEATDLIAKHYGAGS